MPLQDTDDLPIDDPTALAALGRLDVVARLIVEGYMVGQHKSPFKGSSVEFVEHRQYYPGDEIRHIDWRAYGKTGHYFIKEFEEETNLRCYLIVDCSGSMAYGQSTISKFDYARHLAAAIGYLLGTQRDAVGLITFDDRVRSRIEPAANQQNFRLLTQTLIETEPEKETSLSGVFAELIPTLKRRSLVVIISDFFDQPEPLGAALHQFQHARHDVVLLQVVTSEEEDFPFNRPTQFRNLERDRHRLLVDPHRLRAIYLERYREFATELRNLAGAAGFELLKFTTDTSFRKPLGAFLTARSRRSGRK